MGVFFYDYECARRCVCVCGGVSVFLFSLRRNLLFLPFVLKRGVTVVVVVVVANKVYRLLKKDWVVVQGFERVGSALFLSLLISFSARMQ